MDHLTHSVVYYMVLTAPNYKVVLNKNHNLFTNFTEKMMKNNSPIDFSHMMDKVVSFGNFFAPNCLPSLECNCIIAIFR